MADNPRIDELRRRVHQEPASIAFAQLAEELRRSARFLEAVAVCRDGLEMYPGYLSVRVTLGRCLIELDRLDEAERELEQVRETAPDNLAAIRALSKLHQQRRAVAGALPQGGGGQPAGDLRLTPEVADAPPVTTQADAPLHVDPPTTRRARTISEDEYMHIIRTLTALEAWLDGIHVARAGRSA
jgi:tetratricopeptide (TPR) repeat protein